MTDQSNTKKASEAAENKVSPAKPSQKLPEEQLEQISEPRSA